MKISVVIKTQFFSFKSHALSTFLKHFQIGQDPFLNILLQEREKIHFAYQLCEDQLRIFVVFNTPHGGDSMDLEEDVYR